MSEIYLADYECKVSASEALQEIDKQYLGWGWNTEQTTLDLVDYAKDLERQLEETKGVIASVEKAIKLNFHDVERLECCTETANWVLEKIEQLKEQG